jgi:glyoxylase-like metal-dependent hydrolase (beta-lactamase superfamily II)
MRKAALRTIVSAILLLAISTVAGAAGFHKVSVHFYYLESKSGGSNTGAIVTQEGVVLIDPPPEPEMPAMLTALKAVTSHPVRWVISTDYQRERSGGAATLLKLGAAIIGSKELDRLAASAPAADPAQVPAAPPALPNPRFLFSQLLHLFPSGIEIRVLAVKAKARTAGDVVVFLPTEKVLEVGDFITLGSFPIIDSGPGEGSAQGWIDALKQVVEFVPLLKSAMPQPKPEAGAQPEAEKTLEEMVTVVPGHGVPGNLQQVKTLLAISQKLRAEATRAVNAGRTREEFVKSLSPDVFGAYGNLEPFAGQLFDELSKR